MTSLDVGGWAWLAKLPTTQFRILVTVTLIVVVVLSWTVTRLWLGHTDAVPDLTGMFVFLGALAGVDVAQFFFKRSSYQGDPPQPDREDAPALGTTPEAHP